MDSMTQKEIQKLLDDGEIREIPEYKLDDMYRDMLDEVYGDVKIAGMRYSTSRALALLDETAYRTGFNDWLDGEDIIEGPDGKYYTER